MKVKELKEKVLNGKLIGKEEVYQIILKASSKSSI